MNSATLLLYILRAAIGIAFGLIVVLVNILVWSKSWKRRENMNKECAGEGSTHYACPCFLENQQKAIALKRELVEALKELLPAACDHMTSRHEEQFRKRFDALITRAEATLL